MSTDPPQYIGTRAALARQLGGSNLLFGSGLGQEVQIASAVATGSQGQS